MGSVLISWKPEERAAKNVFENSLKIKGPTMIVAKTKETGEFPEVTPVEPEFTTYRFRNSMLNNNEAKL